MERTRSEMRQMERERRKRRKLRILKLTGAISLLMAAGIAAWGIADSGLLSHSSPDAAPSQVPVSDHGGTTANESAGNSGATAAADPTQEPSSTDGGAAPSPANGDAKDTVKIAFVGDVIFASTVEKVLKQNGYDYPYKEVLPYLQDPDLTVANLETPITDKGAAQEKEYIYRSSPLALPAFAAAGFDVVNLANNHVMDYGAEGLLDTLDALDQAGIKRTGAGRDIDEAYKPAILERNGLKVAFLGFSRKVPDSTWKAGKDKPGTTQLYNDTRAIEAIKEAKQQADLVIVIAHWGEERKDTPEQYQRDLSKRFIDAGADLIVGGHPHVLQGLEQYKGKWIEYSLGNFIFTTNPNPATWDTIILNATCTKNQSCTLQAVPILNKGAKPVKMGEAESSQLFQRLTNISFRARVDEKGYIYSEDQAQ